MVVSATFLTPSKPFYPANCNYPNVLEGEHERINEEREQQEMEEITTLNRGSRMNKGKLTMNRVLTKSSSTRALSGLRMSATSSQAEENTEDDNLKGVPWWKAVCISYLNYLNDIDFTVTLISLIILTTSTKLTYGDVKLGLR